MSDVILIKTIKEALSMCNDEELKEIVKEIETILNRRHP